MGGTGVATLVRTGVLCGPETAAQHKPLGLGSSTLPHQPLGACPRGPRRLQRQWTTAKPRRGDVSCNVLPFFLDLSLAFAPGVQFFDAIKSSVDSEVVFQATLQVPAHHALACRVNAYGTPFAAPDLQAAAHELRDEDLEFAACLATPPDLDEQLSVNFGRVMSLLEKNQGQNAGQIATRAAPARAAPAGGSGAGAMQQQIRSTPGASQQAPKVLVSVDEAESTMAQLQRQNSARKQPKMSSLMDGYGKRALQALMGLGYLLTVLHEKSLGGRIEFTAALTAASIISPTTSDGHVKPRLSNGLGVLSGLRQLMRECPSLSPMTTPSHSLGRRQAAAAAAAAASAANGDASSAGSRAAAVRDTLSPRRVPQTAASFEAAWDRVLHPPLSSAGGNGSANSRSNAGKGVPAACQGLQLQLSLSAPCRMRSSSSDGVSATPGSTPRAPISGLQQQHSFGTKAVANGSGGTAAAAPQRGSPLAKASGATWQGLWQPQQAPSPPPQQQQQQGRMQTGLEQRQVKQQQLADELLHKTQDLGREGSMDAILDDAIQQLKRQQEPSATDLVTMAQPDESVFAQAAAAADTAGLLDDSAPSTPVRHTQPPSPEQQQQQQPQTPGTGPRSFYLPDQGPMTSPLSSAWPGSSAAGLAPTPFGSPWVNIAAASAARDSASGNASSGSTPGTPQRMLLPVMSMRLTCQPAWQYNSATGAAVAAGSGSTAATAPASPASKDGMRVNDSTCPADQGTGVLRNGASAAGAPVFEGPSAALAGFIAAADAGSGSAGRHVPPVHLHEPTADELRQYQQDKRVAQQQQQQPLAAAAGAEAVGSSALMASPTSCMLPQGLWPTMSFSLVPVRLPPKSPKPVVTTPRASCAV